jgi:hypothetical protein
VKQRTVIAEINVISIISLLLFISSCRCDKEHIYTLTQTSREYFSDFLQGSYWVYENFNDTTDIDTLTLMNRSAGLEFDYTERHCDGDYHEYVNYQLKSSKTNDTFDIKIWTNLNIDGYSIQGKYHNLNLFCLLNLDKSNETFYVNDYFHDILEFYSNYTIKNKTYSDVVRMTFTQFNPPFPDKAPTYYYGRDQGLIEFVIFDHSANAQKRFWLKNSVIVK